MLNKNTASSIIQTVSTLVNNVVSSDMYNDVFWIEIFNEAMSYIYWYHKWSWNVIEEKVSITDSNEVELQYPIQEVILVEKLPSWGTEYWWEEFTHIQYFTSNWNEFKIIWDKLVLDKNYTGDFRVVYRRWFKEYTVDDINKKVDLPFYLNNVLVSLMQFKILPIWLGEGSWGLMNNYLQDAIQQLERYKQIDTYAEVERSLYPKRR